MLIVAVDTSSANGSVALAEHQAQAVGLMELAPLAPRSFSAQLIPALSAMLARNQKTLAQVEGFGVASGPGSFTGLRVGLATVKALAEVTGRPIAPVSVLEALATAAMDAIHALKSTRSQLTSPPATSGQTVLAAIDAGRGQVFLGEYLAVADRVRRVRETLLTVAELIDIRTVHRGSLLVTPDEAISRQLIAQGLEARSISRPDAGTIAQIGFYKIAEGEVVSSMELDANYIRRSDAELFSLPKSSS